MSDMTPERADQWIDWHTRKVSADFDNRLRNNGVNITPLDPEEKDLRTLAKEVEYIMSTLIEDGYEAEAIDEILCQQYGTENITLLYSEGYL